MSEINGRHIALYAVAGLAVLAVGIKYLKSEDGAQPSAPSRPSVAIKKQGPAARVYVSGEVRRAGVYRVSGSSRVVDALEKAGGATPAADLNSVNLAAKLQDGQQVVVPEKLESGAEAGGRQAEGGDAVAKVSLSSATPEQLETLDGVGPATAKKIIDHRQKQGGFGSVEDLKEISGIGEKKFEALKDSVQP